MTQCSTFESFSALDAEQSAASAAHEDGTNSTAVP